MPLLFKKPKVDEQKLDSVEPQEWDFPTGESDDVETPGSLDASITALCGAASDRFQLGGQSVSDARAFLGPILNIEPGALALVNGQEVKDSYLLQKKDRLEFVKKAGEKGSL